ncbi:RNA-directed DNA polymerase [Rhizobium laguerreae]|uniref:RNA-directed DNA polymerase n=1 Tax=Rhizobium TaxID=379 RepID=UPI001C905A54|nr:MULTISPECIES: RNA-directed DNA polymerase [Rhizobium]MBY3296222.1 RNA-directed DNA polymerase [Rhizobium laguerreae]MBY3310959.1 RNA-directed DNA polymerase [Rhizobium laguerreae]MBY3324082.1 RNA-directed DNA polymerase [Rhizobium laguerreae]MBY3540063.1 RNA-directed DNA polymerase [Rhizobium laguerreae]MBY3547799.1 RNA-directed DNA polymerase [Rhizobium laguerreae]
MLAEIKKLPKVKGKPAYRRFVSEKATFYHPRFNNTDRLHSVVNPISHLLVSSLVAKHFYQLKNVERESVYSLSPSVFDWNGQRALPRPVFSKRDEFTSQLSPRFEYTVTTDVRSFYPSVHTASIAWAVHGRDASKQLSKALFANEIGLLVRNGQDGHTTGLPVGPDTSRILAEVVASRIDTDIDDVLKMKKGDAARFVDDFTFGCNSVEEGRRIVAEVRRAAAVFELDIGHEKTSIEPTNHLAYVGWEAFLKSHLPPEDPDKASFERFFYVVHEMTKRHVNLNVERYAMSNCRKSFVASEDWDFLQEHIVSSYRKNSTLIENLVEIVLLRQKAQEDVDLAALSDFIAARLPVLGANQRTGEILWLLYLACSLRIKIKADALSMCLRMPNALIAILVTHAEAEGLIEGAIDRSFWRSFANKAGLRSTMFLFAYEAAVKGWEKDTAYCEADQYYGLLKGGELSFFDIARAPKDLSQVLMERQKQNQFSRFQAAWSDFTPNPDDEDDDFDDLDVSDFEMPPVDPNTY